MTFIRPAARAALWRWREVLLGALLVVLCGVWASSSFGFVRTFALILTGAGIVIVLAGVQRARFGGAKGGPGVVQVIEGQITYYGPLNGGAVALANIATLSIDNRAQPQHWVITHDEGVALQIPVNAEGADTLFDAFTGLRGLRTEHLLTAKQGHAPGLVVIWRRGDVQARINSLH